MQVERVGGVAVKEESGDFEGGFPFVELEQGVEQALAGGEEVLVGGGGKGDGGGRACACQGTAADLEGVAEVAAGEGPILFLEGDFAE